MMYFVLNFSPLYLIYIPNIGKDTVLAIFTFIMHISIFLQYKKLLLSHTRYFLLIIAYGCRANAQHVIPMVIYFAINFFRIVKNKKGQFLRKFNFIKKSYVFVPIFSLLMVIVLIAPNIFIKDTFIKNKCCAGSTALLTPIQDLMGMSYYSQKVLIPKKYLKDSANYLSHLNKYFYPPWNLNFDETQNIHVENTYHIFSTWLNAIKKYPKLYFKNRFDILKRFLGYRFPNPIAYSTGFYFNNFQKSKSLNSIKAKKKFSFITRLDPALEIFQSLTKFYVSKFHGTVFF